YALVRSAVPLTTFCNETAPAAIFPLSLHDALPISGLVVDLGEPTGGPLQSRLARTLRDPSLVVGYWVPDQRRYVDEAGRPLRRRSEEHTSELQSLTNIVCRLLLEKKNNDNTCNIEV